MYPIIGYPSEHSGGISASAPVCSACHRTISAYSNFGRVFLWHTPYLLQYGSTHSSGWRLVIMGITLAIPFSQAPCRVFFLHSNFYLRAHKGAIMALFCYLSFLHGSRTPKFACFACTDYLHNRPLQLATLVCSLAWCGYLTPSLIAPKRTSNFRLSKPRK